MYFVVRGILWLKRSETTLREESKNNLRHPKYQILFLKNILWDFLLVLQVEMNGKWLPRDWAWRRERFVSLTNEPWTRVTLPYPS